MNEHLTAAILLALVLPSRAASYCVDVVNGHDAHRGSSAAPWNHISGVQVARGSKGFGIYLDDGTDYAVIHHNVVDGGGRLRWGIFIHYATHFSDDIGIYHNTLWGVREQAIFAGGRKDVGGTRGFVCRNNLVQRGAIATLRGELNASHNRIGDAADEFVDVQALDFRLRSSKCLAVDAGIVVQAVNDAVVDGKPDLGAYEHGQPPWQAGATVTRKP